MTDITFARTRHVYDSYTDFWRLVELSGFPTIYVDEIDISQPGIIITLPMNEDYREHINNQHREDRPVNAHLILWNIERPSGSTGSVGNYAADARYLLCGLWSNGKTTKRRANGEEVKAYGRFIDEVWVSDRRLADETKHATRFVTLGSHPELGVIDETRKEFSFCHLSYKVGRRQAIYEHFASDEVGPNCWGQQRHEMLKRCRFALNVHQDNHPFQEPLRFALFAAYGLPIVSETIFDSYPWSDEFMVYSDYDHLVSKMKQILAEPYEKYREMGLRARDRMCNEFGFRKMVEQAIEQSVGSIWR